MVAIAHPVDVYSSSFFSFRLKQHSKKVQLVMQFPKKFVTTLALPHTYRFLCEHAPSVLECQCFNDDNLPFSEEVKHTEMAHLFEHILLDQLCQEKATDDDAEYAGETEWNWRKHPVGTFKVTLTVPPSDARYLASALNRSIALMELLFDNRKADSVRQKQPPKGLLLS